MINPDNITNFNQSTKQLQEFMSFWILVAGKTAHTTASRLEKILVFFREQGVDHPFDVWKQIGPKKLPIFLKNYGIGTYNHKAKGLLAIVNSGLDLKKCTLDDLRQVFYQGPKTSRCFLIHSRPNQKLAGLDVHILHLLREVYGYNNAPLQTPGSDAKYKFWEEVVVNIYTQEGKSAAEFDLNGWKKFRKMPNFKVA
jgi:hypothetical protein